MTDIVARLRHSHEQAPNPLVNDAITEIVALRMALSLCRARVNQTVADALTPRGTLYAEPEVTGRRK